MVDKTQRHRNHWTQWTVAEITFVGQHYVQFSATEIGEKLGRTACAVIAKASLLGGLIAAAGVARKKTF
ncbi:hypothetical protein I6U52_25250 [Serratia marcescens]|nr:hypothetical protein [Serratia marcescens]MBH2866160.1 hypothetical protein [Serratia marcescens]MBW4239741.1 hypothetical protein [Enterobacter roggenkampii]